MLADIVMLGTDRNGSFALADIKKSILSNSVQSLVKDIANVINENAVKNLFKYNNFPGITDILKIVPAEVEAPSLKEIGDFVRATGISALNDPVVAKYLKEIAGIPTHGASDNVQDTENQNEESEVEVETDGTPAKGKVGTADYNAVYYGG
jgi:hypothetical protein